MSYEELMQHAQAIRIKAIEKAMPVAVGPIYPTSTMERMRAMTEREFADIPELFQPYAEMPDPASFGPMIGAMRQALDKLCTGQEPRDPIDGDLLKANSALDKMDGAESYLEDWSGRAAMEFKSHVIDPFPSIVRNQFTLAAVLKAALEAEQAIWQQTRTDIDTIAHKTLEALDHMDDCSSNEWTIAFTVVASVAAIAAIPATAGGSAAAAFTVIGATAQVAAAIPPGDPPRTEYSGETAQDVIGAMRSAIATLTNHIGDTERRVQNALERTHELVSANRNSFVARRPRLADATADTVTGPEQMGYST